MSSQPIVSSGPAKSNWQKCKAFAENHKPLIIKGMYASAFIGCFAIALAGALAHSHLSGAFVFGGLFGFGFTARSVVLYENDPSRKAKVRSQHKAFLSCYEKIRRDNPEALLPEISLSEATDEEKTQQAKEHLQEKAVHITKLDLTDISLESWPESLELPHLESLNLSKHPNFSKLPSDFFQNHPRLKELRHDSLAVHQSLKLPLNHQVPLTVDYGNGLVQMSVQPRLSS